MANREACEVYLEQEIKSGLEQGKTPYSIGKELSHWIEKFFETKIAPATIKSRAYRQQQKSGSNEPKKSKTRDNPASTMIYDSGRGGQRNGAGRPNLPKAAAQNDSEYNSKFSFPVRVLADCPFTPKEIVLRLFDDKEQLANFKKVNKFFKKIERRISNG